MRQYLNKNHATPEMKQVKKEIKKDIKRFFTEKLGVEEFLQPEDKINLYLAGEGEEQRPPYFSMSFRLMAPMGVTEETVATLAAFLTDECAPRAVSYLAGEAPNELTLYVTFNDYEAHTYDNAADDTDDVVNYEVVDEEEFNSALS